MKALHTLLKLARRDLETLRRALADQIGKQSMLEQRALAHEQTIVAEQKAALRDYESARTYGGYAMAAINVRRALESETQIVSEEIQRLRTLITEAHVESRKFERLIELEAAREKAKREKRENDELDEMATLRAGRAARVRT